MQNTASRSGFTGPNGRSKWAVQMAGPVGRSIRTGGAGDRDERLANTDAGCEFLRAGRIEVWRGFSGRPGFLGQQHAGQLGTICGAVDE